MREQGAPKTQGLVAALLEEIAEEQRLAALLGTSVAPADPLPEHAPRQRLPLDEWLRRSEEVHRFLCRDRRRAHR